jgi:diguanylate cyclase (GGDEF)-like protein
LVQVAATLRAVCREGDAAGRYGGDEFAVLLRGASSSAASAVIRRLSSAVQAHPWRTITSAGMGAAIHMA